MKYIKYELAEMEERKNLLINQLDIFTKKHKFNKNDYLEKIFKRRSRKLCSIWIKSTFSLRERRSWP